MINIPQWTFTIFCLHLRSDRLISILFLEGTELLFEVPDLFILVYLALVVLVGLSVGDELVRHVSLNEGALFLQEASQIFVVTTPVSHHQFVLLINILYS